MHAEFPRFSRSARFVAVWIAGAALAVGSTFALGPRGHNPTSKFYVADVEGEAEIDTGRQVFDLTKNAVYAAEGSVVETKLKASNAMVFSNGTGILFDEDTRLEVRKFQQEPFLPHRTDMDMEPSVSQTQAFLDHGVIALCTSRLVAGSTMTYGTAQGSVNIRGGKLVISAQDNATTISMIQGEVTVIAGPLDQGGQLLRNGQQAILTRGAPGQPSHVTIQEIPDEQKGILSAKITMSCTAKRTVYFEMQTQVNSEVSAQSPLTQGNPGSFNPNLSSATNVPNSPFDGNDGETNPLPNQTTNTIVAIPVVPQQLPVDFTVSPASL